MTQSAATPLRRMLGLLGTASAIALAAGLVWLGSTHIADRAEATEIADIIDPIPVVAAPLERVSSYDVSTRYPGRVEARQSTQLAFERGGTVTEVLVDEGDPVAAGQPVARLDTRDIDARADALRARMAALAAQADLARLTAERQKALLDRNHVAPQRFDEARLTLARLEAEMRALKADLQAIDLEREKLTLSVPFDAVAGRRMVDAGSRVGPGQPVLELFQSARPQFRLGLPPDQASQLAEGMPVPVTLGAGTFEGRVARIRRDIDPVTRTTAVIVDLPAGTDLSEGALGSVTLRDTVAAQGAWVPVTALAEGVRGLWSLYLIEEGETGAVARKEAVELLHADGERAFVRGAFGPAVRIVAEGPHRVANGQPVTVAQDD